MPRIAVIAVAGWALLSTARADDTGPRPQPLTLREAVTTALARNPELVGLSMDVEVADARAREAAGAFDTTLEAEVTAGVRRQDPTTGVFVDQLGQDAVVLRVGATRHLTTGGSVALQVEAGASRTTHRFSQNGRSIDDQASLYQPAVRVAWVQPLLKGRGAGARLTSDRARTVADASVLRRGAAAATTVRDVVVAYWELGFARQALTIRRSSRDLAREQLRIVRLAISLGKSPPDAAAEVEVEVGLREEDVLVAENEVAERSLELRRLAGLELGPGAILVDPIDQPRATGADPDLDRAVAQALVRSPELETARAERRVAAIDLRAGDDGLRPQLDLRVDVRASGRDRDAGNAVGRMTGYGGLDANVGLALSLPLGGDGVRGARDAARGQVVKARAREADLAAQVTLAVVRTVNQVRLASQRQAALARSAELGLINLQHENQRFDLGRSTSFDVLKRQRELAETQLRQARAAIDRVEAVARLDALTGDLLTGWGIAIAEGQR